MAPKRFPCKEIVFYVGTDWGEINFFEIKSVFLWFENRNVCR
jgi:hypothetical protein